MYILYIDESGDPYVWDDQKCFVLAGVAVHEAQVQRFTEEVAQVQQKYLPDVSVPIGLHATDIRNGKGVHFKTLSRETRTSFMHDIYEVVARAHFPELVTFATIVDASAVQDAHQVIRDSFEDICTRFNAFLVRQCDHGFKDKGLLVIDKAHEEHYRQLFSAFQNKTRYGFIGNLVDIPYFATRHDTRMLQLADFCAYAAYRRYQVGDDSFFQRVLLRFERRTRDHHPDGLKHITKSACVCESCDWREPES